MRKNAGWCLVPRRPLGGSASASRTNLRELNELNFARFDAKLEQRIAEVKELISTQRANLITWMFVFWVGNVATTAGLMFAFVHLMRP